MQPKKQKNKSKVFFLGAGASKAFGYPLTGEIMPSILANLRANNLFQLEDTKTSLERAQERELRRFLELLYPGLASVDPGDKPECCPGIIEVLSLVEHCVLYNTPPHPLISGANLERFRYLLSRAIAELLLYYEVTPYNTAESRLLKQFTQLIRKPGPHDVTVITTNYDLIIDRAFKPEMRENKVNFGIAYRHIKTSELITPPPDAVLRLYKLHGSLNWLRCDLCGQYYINPEGSITVRAFDEEIGEWNTCDCSDVVQLKAVLVAPSLVRDIRDPNLLQIWNAALEAIRTAHELTFMGYSLPAEDLAIKALILRGINGRNPDLPPLKITVVQRSDAAKQNYNNLLGTTIDYNSKGLEDYLQSQ